MTAERGGSTQMLATRACPDRRAVTRDVLERFVRPLLRQVDPEDLDRARARRPLRRRAVALELRAEARAGPRDVRVFNPTIEEHGWQSTHTIIEIVNDDMPFLVDSVTMEVNRHGLTLHLIVHPILAVVREHGRDADRPGAAKAPDALRESFIHVEVDRIDRPGAPRGARRRRRARARRRAHGGRPTGRR